MTARAIPALPPLVRYPRTGTYRRCVGIDCGAVKPAAAFARGGGQGFFHFCDTCRDCGPDSRAKERAAKRAALRDAKRAAHLAARDERRFWLRQLQQKAKRGAT